MTQASRRRAQDRGARVGLVAGGLVLGLGAELAASGSAQWHRAAADLAAGWALLGGGVWAWSRAPANHLGPLLAAAGVAWFAGTVGAFGGAALYLHRALLIHAVLAYPSGHVGGRLERGAVAAAYLAAIVPALARDEVVSLALALLVLIVAVRRASFGDGRWVTPGALSAGLVAVALAEGAIARAAAVPASTDDVVLVGYQVALAAAALVLGAAVGRQAGRPAEAADLVVELGEEPSTLRAALARALGDPQLRLGFWAPRSGDYLDAQGGTVRRPDPAGGRSLLVIDGDRGPFAVVEHDAAVVEGHELCDAVSLALRLSASNERLQAEVEEQVEDLRRSRRRILEAGVAQRRRLARRLHDRVERRLDALAHELGDCGGETGADAEVRGLLGVAVSELDAARGELRELAMGIHPRVLFDEGLAPALSELARRAAVPVDLEVSRGRYGAAVESTAYFVSCEALANVAKYSHASRISLRVVERDDTLVVTVADDGVGGADPRRGSGLRGLVDRVEGLGGTLRVASPAKGGTRVVAALPLVAAISGSSATDGPRTTG
jgi:signal transduction histidine kinase